MYVIHNLQNFHTFIENTLKKLFSIQINENNFHNNEKGWNKKYYRSNNLNTLYHNFFRNFMIRITTEQ